MALAFLGKLPLPGNLLGPARARTAAPLSPEVRVGAAQPPPGAASLLGAIAGLALAASSKHRHGRVPQAARQASRTKTLRDPERPKLPLTPWVLFIIDFAKQAMAAKAKKANAKPLKAGSLFKDAAVQWSKIKPAQKKKYVTPYQKQKKVYDAAFAEYVSSGKRDAWRRDPEKPKRPLSPYFRFLQKFRTLKKNRALTLVEASREGAKAWNSFSEKQKAPYSKTYPKEKLAYAAAMKAYKESGKEEAWLAKKGIVRDGTAGIKNAAQNA